MRITDYFKRIGIDKVSGGGVEALRRLHLAHRETFLFDNLSIQTGEGISLSLSDLERKFIDQGRGGYCFEHNTLFAAALRELGFSPTILLGRVRRGPPERWVRTHMVLQVAADGAEWLADVGFGGLGPLEPMPFVPGASVEQGGFRHTLRRDGRLWILEMRDSTSTTSLYEFTDDPQTPADVEAANHFTATHPDSIFRKTLTIQRHRPDERTILRNNAVSRYRAGEMTEDAIAPGELPRAVRSIFGIELPAGPLVFEAERAS